MTNLRVLFALIGIQCIFSPVISTKVTGSGWLYASNFTSDELANLTPQKEHELLLKSLAEKPDVPLGFVFYAELLANGIGNDFFEFISDEKASVETKPIVKAMFHCIAQLRTQERATKTMESAVRKATEFLKETGNIGTAYTKVCSKIDDDLKNETVYTTFKDEYKKQAGQLAKKTYHYGIPKSEADLQKSFSELANDPQSKKLSVVFTFVFFGKPEEIYVSQAVRELEKLPGKGEAVQKIFDETTNEMIPLVKDVSPAEINMQMPFNIRLEYLRKTLREKLDSNMKANLNVKEDYEKIYEHIRVGYEGRPWAI